jgi:putative Ig domain-containing protein
MRVLRILLLVVLVSAIAGVVASSAGALGYEDEPCPLNDPSDHQLKVCHPDAEVGKPYSLQIKGKGGCTPDFVRYDVVAGTLPPGLSVEPSTALVSGTPTAPGVYRFWLQVSDLPQSWCTDDKKSQWQFQITVLQGLQIVQRQSSLTPGQVGQTYNMQFTASGATPTGWSVSSGSLPAGLTLNSSSGLLAGTPTTTGDYSFQVSATDGTQSDTQSYSMSVVEPLKVTAPTAAAAEVNRPFNLTLTATGGKQAYKWSIPSDSPLPAGLTLDAAAGTISGSPTTAGVGVAKVTVTDALGLTSTVDVNLAVAQQLAIAKAPLRTAKVGRKYRARLFATGGVPLKRWAVIAGKLPKGIRLNAATGTLTGTPTVAGRKRFTVRVTDKLGAVTHATYLLKVTT